MHPRVMTRHVLIAVTERKVRARTRVTGLTFFWRIRSTARENTNPRIHVSLLSVTYGKRTRKRTVFENARGTRDRRNIFRISWRCFKQHFFQNCPKPLQNLPTQWQISTTMDGVAISHDYCHESGLIYVPRTHSFHLSELSTGVRKFPSQRNYPPFYFFSLFFSSLFPFFPSLFPFFYIKFTKLVKHSISWFTELTLHYLKRWISALIHGVRNYRKVSHTIV